MPPLRNRLRVIERKRHAIDDSLLPPGSDVRVPRGVFDSCILCENKLQLQLSHVIPKWMYRVPKDEGQLLGKYNSLGVITVNQDGAKHYLLCFDCEQLISTTEHYISNLQSEHPETDWNRIGVTDLGQDHFYGFKRSIALKFILSVALRCHFSVSPPSHKIGLSKAFIRDARSVLLDRRAAAPFDLFAFRFFSKEAPGVNPRGMIYPGQGFIKTAGELFTLLGGGWEWNVVRITFRNPRYPGTISKFLIRDDKPVYVPSMDIVYQRFVNPDEVGWPKPEKREKGKR